MSTIQKIMDATIVTGEYTDSSGQQKKTYLKVGTLFVYQDGGMSLKLDALPLGSGNINFYDRKPKNAQNGQNNAQQPQGYAQTPQQPQTQVHGQPQQPQAQQTHVPQTPVQQQQQNTQYQQPQQNTQPPVPQYDANGDRIPF